MPKRSYDTDIHFPAPKTHIDLTGALSTLLSSLVSTGLSYLEGTTSDLSKTDGWIGPAETSLATDAKDIQATGLTYLSMDQSEKDCFRERVQGFANSSREFFTYLKARAAEMPWDVKDGVDRGDFHTAQTIASCETLTRLGANILKAVSDPETSDNTAQDHFRTIHEGQPLVLLRDEFHENTHKRMYDLHNLWVRSKMPEPELVSSTSDMYR